MSVENNYFLSVGAADEQRLALLNEVYNPYSQVFLQRAGLKSGMSVLEIGCGTGIMSQWIAQQVGHKGSVLATDMSADQIKIARSSSEKKQIKNIQFEVVSVSDLENLAEQFDLIYSRFLLSYLPDPVAGLKTMISRLKSAGILAMEAAVSANIFVYPESKAVSDRFQAINNLFNSQHQDANFGKKIASVYYDLQLKNITSCISQPVLLTSREKSLVPLGIHSARNSLLQIGYSQDRINEILENLTHFLEDPRAVCGFYPVNQIAGEKP